VGIGKMSTGDSYGYTAREENGEFCITVGLCPETGTVDILTSWL